MLLPGLLVSAVPDHLTQLRLQLLVLLAFGESNPLTPVARHASSGECVRRGLPPLTCSDIGLSLRGLKNTWEFRFGLSFASTGLGPWAQGGERLPRRVMWVRAAAEGWAVMFVWRRQLHTQ